jgi:hypothetical protein
MNFVFFNLSRRAWVGSLLFHLVLLLIFVFLLGFQPVRESLTEVRNASGGILVKQSSNNIVQYSGGAGVEFTDSKQFSSESEIVAGLSTDFAPLAPPKRIGSGVHAEDSEIKLFGGSKWESGIAGRTEYTGVGGGGGKKLLHVFGTQGEGNNFVFVFDKSGSMNERGGIPFKAAKGELLRNIGELNDAKYKLNIIFYNDNVTQWSEKGMLEATELNCKSAFRFVQGEVARGNTKHFDPLVVAIRQKPDVIFFLTDGDDNDAMTQMQLAEIKRINQSKVIINVIQFGVGKYRSSDFLIQLAKENNGLYLYIDVTELNQ